MADLPIKVSSPSAKPASSKPSANNNDAAQQDAQEFGNVLARQVADTAKPAETAPRSAGGKAQQDAETDSTDTSRADASGDSLPADMLAALLAQQNPAVPTQQDIPAQSSAEAMATTGVMTTTWALANPEAPTQTQPIVNANVLSNFPPQPDAKLQPVMEAHAAGFAAVQGSLPSGITNPANLDMPEVDAGALANPEALTHTQTIVNAKVLSNFSLQPDAKQQPVMDAQVAAGFAAVQDSLPSGITNPANLTMPEVDGAALQHGNAKPEVKSAADKVKTSIIGEISHAYGKQTAQGAGVIIEAASTMQPAMMPLPAGATANASPVSINADLTQPAWGDEFSQKITWMATQRNQSAELHLNPPQLGPLDVVLKMNGDQATAMFTSPHAAVREAIEQAIPKLREMMAESGIMLGNAMVSDHSAKNNQDNSPRKAQGKSLSSAEVTQGSAIQEARVSPIRQHNGMVDTFA